MYQHNFAFAAPASDQQVQQLLKVMNIDELLQETIQQIRPQLDQQAYQIIQMTVKKDQLKPQEQIVANELADKMYEQSKNQLGIKSNQFILRFIKTYTVLKKFKLKLIFIQVQLDSLF
jgi:uncharacterized protein YdhG (YjbR/CyaY superfamily)